ncbi:CAI-1 autoinducer sensor kinase/phosphatase CqsS [bacterium BMS3Abin07]|nr:CAI-1 autoinducer sensor kinase/phosphatase CqsS [bacterium BMS3Abin07]GBE31949.1 CAI-1 autoinducer sensor kinase/phosphatase CqsS [bacterium BMS3Bbin05]HDL21075.1 response regulator [Nitrospirota bacterium]HDO22269.1 response regulator [Nitrospirota bacterium]
MDDEIKKRILCIDDDSRSRKIVKEILEWNGYEVVTANGADDALEFLSTDYDFDLIIMDILMPDMTGIDLAEKLRSSRETSGIPILGISAHLDEKGDMAVDDFLGKPLSHDALAEKVRRLTG